MADYPSNTDLVDEIAAVPPQDLVFFIGAGVSKPPPACLPTGEELRRSLAAMLIGSDTFRTLPVDLAATLAAALGGCELPVPGLQERLQVHGVPLEGLLDIYDAQIGEGPVKQFLVRNLASGTSNKIHSTLAGCLAASPPAASAIVTTNYDTLIEQCWTPAARENTRIFEERQLDSWSPALPPLFKIHGSIDEPRTVVSSLSAERALPPWKRDLLKELIHGKTVVVFGYSGFDFDICPLLLKAGASRFYWNLHGQNADVSLDARRILGFPSTVAMCGDAVPFFQRLSATLSLEQRASVSMEPEPRGSQSSARPCGSLPVDTSAFPPGEAARWACLAALDVGAGSAALALLAGMADDRPSLRNQVWYQKAKARAHFLESHTAQSLALSEQGYTAALRASEDAVERIELSSARLGLAETRASLLRVRSPAAQRGSAADRGSPWWTQMAAIGGRWLGIWVRLLGASVVCWSCGFGPESVPRRKRLSSAAGNLHLLAAQAVESLHEALKRGGRWTQVWRIARCWAAFHLWRAKRHFDFSDNYFGSQHAKRLHIRLESRPALTKAQLSEDQVDLYRRLGYITAWSNSVRDVIRWRIEAGSGRGLELDKLSDLAAQAQALSRFIGDEPGTVKARELTGRLSELRASLSQQ